LSDGSNNSVPRSTPLVLIVEDDQASRETYAEWASAFGFQVAQAHNGFQALEKAASLVPNIITTTLNLGYGLDGLEFCRRLKKEVMTQAIPVVALTGRGTVTEVEEAKRAGCTSVLPKPCPPNMLLAEILRILDLSPPQHLMNRPDDALQTALRENARLRQENADLQRSANLWASWYELQLRRANRAEAALRGFFSTLRSRPIE
jgi:CheY-like chemotaxis protein